MGSAEEEAIRKGRGKGEYGDGAVKRVDVSRAAIARSKRERSAAHHGVDGAAGRSESPRARRDEGDSEKWWRCRDCGVA